MAYEHKEGQGSLFKNEKQNDRQPDYKGTILIGGTTYEIAAWERTSQRGTAFLSLQASLPRDRTTTQQPYQQQAAPAAPSYEGYADSFQAGDIPEDLPF